jgi:CRISPR-associated protein Cmr5
MNKQRVNEWIAPAAEALTKTGIAESGKINSTFRGQISTFGAAVTMGSLKAAAAFFSQQGNASVHRELLLKAMYYVVTGELKEPGEVFAYICTHDDVRTRDQFLDAAIALKLAMNLYDLGQGGKQNEESEPAVQ